MIARLLARFTGASLSARALRSSFLMAGGFGFSLALRLGSNLILTRLLFPEAFGLMALVSVVLMGLAQFSDVGTTAAILQNKRGDDPAFLDTAWTIQVARGVVLWLVACLLAVPFSHVYGEPMLAQILPVASLSLLIMGFRPTRMDTANRHLLLGRVTVLGMATGITGATVSVTLAYLTGSVWALVVGTLCGSLAEVLYNAYFLPGHRNRFRLERDAAHELIRFGKWVFMATIAGFVWNQADKMLIGKYLPIDMFGIYNIGFFLASFPMMLGGRMMNKLLIPIYRESPPQENRANFLKIRRMRCMMTSGLLAMSSMIALGGVWLIDVLYDPRYAMAGAVAVMVAMAQVPLFISQTYGFTALATGQSRLFFGLAATRATLMVACIVAGLALGGLFGGIAGIGIAYVLSYPAEVWLARQTGAWDPLHDGMFAALGLIIVVTATLINQEAIEALMIVTPEATSLLQ